MMQRIRELQDRVQTDERAVSPVIGVILMVAITVILAAVIGTFVLNMSGSLQRNAQAGVTFEQSGSGPYNVTVQVVSMSNADSLDYSVTDNSGDGDGVSSTNLGSSVGASATINSLEAGDKVTVTATLNGQTSVIQSYTVK